LRFDDEPRRFSHSRVHVHHLLFPRRQPAEQRPNAPGSSFLLDTEALPPLRSAAGRRDRRPHVRARQMARGVGKESDALSRAIIPFQASSNEIVAGVLAPFSAVAYADEACGLTTSKASKHVPPRLLPGLACAGRPPQPPHCKRHRPTMEPFFFIVQVPVRCPHSTTRT